MGLLLRLISKSRSIFRTSTRKPINNNCRSSSSSSSSSSFSTCSSIPSSSPWLMLPPEEGGRAFNFYSVAENKVVSFKNSTKLRDVDECEFVGSSHGWLALFNPRNNDMSLFNPLTGSSIELPAMETVYTPPNERTNAWVYKIILTCPPDSPQELCRAVMLYNGNRLAYCTPGSSTGWLGPIDPHFTPRPGDWGSWGRYDDFVAHTKNKLLICIGDGLEAWNISTSEDDEFHPKSLRYQNRCLLSGHQIRERITEDGYSFYPYKNLVMYGSQIYLVFRDAGYYIESDPEPDADIPQKTLGFHVHKIGMRGLVGEREASLNGLAMFVGRNHSFALPAAQYPGLKPNSIYFTQHWSSISPRRVLHTAFGGHDIGVFDYENNTISPCYYPCDIDSFKRIVPAPLWFTPSPSPSLAAT